jgi:hypothetical protein
MKANEFASKICDGLNKLPDSDGEPGYFSTAVITPLTNETATIDVTVLADDIQEVEEDYLVIVIKKPR